MSLITFQSNEARTMMRAQHSSQEKKVSGPQLPYSQELHAQKYRGEGEGFREAMSRVAGALQDNDVHYHEFRDILLDMRFLPAGRVQSAMGSARQVTPYNCYVSGTIEDSFVEGHGCIMDRAKEAATTMRMGGGIGYDFSTLRPRGDSIRKLRSHSSGPISFMEVFDAICRCVASSGHRRGAQMGVLRVDHPDIEEFIDAKQNQTRLTGFNISIAITDEFMQAVEDGKSFMLRWGGRDYREVDARSLWEKIMRSTWDWAEPGVLFIDAINRENNLWYCEKIAATNPCGEQPLPPFGACLLGSFNLVRYVGRVPETDAFFFDMDQFKADIPVVVSAMDNVVDRAIYPLPEQKQEALNKRRMGLGVTGLANAGEALGFEYGSAEFLEFTEQVLTVLRDEAYTASALRAAQKGAFPLFQPELYLKGEFISRLPDRVKDLIRKHGIRNSHLTSIAPTGTISLCADNVSSGIEPVFAYSFDRTVIEFTGPRIETVTDYGAREFGVRGKVSSRVTAQEHVAVLALCQSLVDSAVSKTCNVGPEVGWDEFKEIYLQAWRSGAKGCTTFRANGKRAGILNVKEDDSQQEREDVAGVATPEPAAACRIDPETGRRECD